MTKTAAEKRMKSYLASTVADGPFHPGVFLQRELWARNVTARALADRIGMKVATIDGVLAKRYNITPYMAIKLAHVFGQAPHEWLTLQMHYGLKNRISGATAVPLPFEPFAE